MTLADKLFLHFQWLPGTDVVGLGLGLATVDRIITRRFGRVWAESKQVEDESFFFNFR